MPTTTCALFKFVAIERVEDAVKNSNVGYFSNWPNLKMIIFSQNNVHSLTQLDWLAKLAPQIKEVRASSCSHAHAHNRIAEFRRPFSLPISCTSS